MNKSDKIYIAGHRGLVGSAIRRTLLVNGHTNLLVRSHAELDLTDAAAVSAFLADEQPDFVSLKPQQKSAAFMRTILIPQTSSVKTWRFKAMSSTRPITKGSRNFCF